MVLSTTERNRAGWQWMRDNLETCSFTKVELAGAIAAADDWVETNLTAYNLALPLGFRSAATVTQKAMVLAYVLWRRIGKLRTQED